MASVRGQLLVATSAIGAGPFWRSVVFLLDHDDDGALGVIVNRPTESDLDDVLPAWAAAANAPGCLFQGGPVATDAALAVGVLADPASSPPGWQQMAGRVGLVDLEAAPPTGGDFVGLRVFAGYAGWSAGQLEAEIAEGSWLVLPAQDADLLSPSPELLWREVLRRQRGDTRFWSTLPDDPGLN